VYRIPKRTTGFRIAAQPAKELKAYQCAFIELFHFPVHECATACTKPGRILRKMFVKLETAKHLETNASGEQAALTLTPAVQRLAASLLPARLDELAQDKGQIGGASIIMCKLRSRNAG